MKKVGIIGGCEAAIYNNYHNAVEACGAAAVQLWGAQAADLVKTLDGVLLPGGWDLAPARYGEADTACQHVDPERDRLEWDVLTAALCWHKPVLGVCRGLQLLNVYFGGSLYQDIPNAARHTGIPVGDGCKDNVHGSRVTAGSFLHTVYGAEQVAVNSSHHQAVKVLGAGLTAVQYSDDGVLEGLCHNTLPLWGVQWHPERMCLCHARPDTVDGGRLFAWFLDRC